jgi:hypothetical protein
MISDGELTGLRGLGVDEVGVDFGPKAETRRNLSIGIGHSPVMRRSYRYR